MNCVTDTNIQIFIFTQITHVIQFLVRLKYHSTLRKEPINVLVQFHPLTVRRSKTWLRICIHKQMCPHYAHVKLALQKLYWCCGLVHGTTVDMTSEVIMNTNQWLR